MVRLPGGFNRLPIWYRQLGQVGRVLYGFRKESCIVKDWYNSKPVYCRKTKVIGMAEYCFHKSFGRTEYTTYDPKVISGLKWKRKQNCVAW